ncbi:MAG: hypothetical protein HY321_14565 [Armatimonadetes bacterium]|nr:hypothetical protein [Armatimonadota bacterium]
MFFILALVTFAVIILIDWARERRSGYRQVGSPTVTSAMSRRTGDRR